VAYTGLLKEKGQQVCRSIGEWASLRRGTDDLVPASLSDKLSFPNHSRSSRPPIGESCVPVNLTYFVLMPARALTTACGFCQVSSNTVAYSPDDRG
jgi:hypothetical protein